MMNIIVDEIKSDGDPSTTCSTQHRSAVAMPNLLLKAVSVYRNPVRRAAIGGCGMQHAKARARRH